MPADAKVIINGLPTTSVGEHRTFFSTGLQAATPYRYQVRAEFVRDGKPVSQERIVELTAGQTRSVEFGDTTEAPATDTTMPAATSISSSQ